MARQEFARLSNRPTGAGSLRSSQSPSERRSTWGHSTRAWPSASRGETRWRTEGRGGRSEEHTSELQSLMRISYAVFCLKKKKTKQTMVRKQSIKHTQKIHHYH